MGKKQYIMSPSELRTLREERQFTEKMLNDTESEQYGAGSRGSQLDKGALKRQANQFAKQEHMYAPKALRGANKDKVAKEAKALERQFMEGMPTREEMTTSATAHKLLNWEKRNGSRVREWKQLQRRLEPGDPTASNVERLRRK